VGKVFLVGAGPGAPDLLTLRAARLLEAADVVFHDALVHPATLALAKGARLVDVGKRYGKVSTEQRFINRALIEAARMHATVVRLKGGDPMIFGRAQEELDALAAAGIDCEVVPGVTAALAAAAALGTSLTRRGIARTVAFLTPRVGRDETSSEWLPAALGADSVVLYMARAPRNRSPLSDRGGKAASTPVAAWKRELPERTRLTRSRRCRRAMPRAAGPVVMASARYPRPRRRPGTSPHAQTRRAMSGRVAGLS
jgi:uroporphyrin-III C-methyltransferase